MEFQVPREPASDEEEDPEIDEEDEQLRQVLALLNFSEEQEEQERRENLQRAEKAEDKCQRKSFKVRPGDWFCMKCANINFQFRSRCNLCETSREESESLARLFFSLKKKEKREPQETVQKASSTEPEQTNKSEHN